MISRRQLLLAFGAGTVGTPLCARAQQPGPARVGWISLDRAEGTPYFEPFRAGLHELGWVEGRNLTISWRGQTR
jgi:hypothetical protein